MNLNELAKQVHAANVKWWQGIETGNPIERNKGELIALMHSELSEMLEGVRKDLQDDKIPEYKMEIVEAVDCIIRILDYLDGFGYGDLIQEVFDAKMRFNATRLDHRHEARKLAGGKKF